MWQPLTPEEALVVLPTGGKRTISQTVLSGRLAMEPVPPADTKSWTSQFRRDGAAPGSIASLNGTRSQVFAQAVKATSMWLQAQGFGSFSCRASLLACAGAQYHHDATYFPNDVFCVLWLSDKTPWDVYFPFLERRIPLELGTVLAFDSAQPHGVVARDCVEFHPDSFRGAPGFFCSQEIGLTAAVRRRMAIRKLSERGRRGCIGIGDKPTRTVWMDEIDGVSGAWKAQPAQLPSTAYSR